jgi:hypothetical protein
VSAKKSGSPTAAAVLQNHWISDFSGQIVHSDLARRRVRACSLLMRHRQRKSWRIFHLKVKTLFIGVWWPGALFDTTAARATCVVRVTVLAYTNSRLEKGVQPAKSHMHETGVKHIFHSLVLHPTKKAYHPFGIQYENMQLTNDGIT